ncbi:3-deoxy-D-manno-octulosonate 8-phosphate phosphatase KdsC [Planctomycetes bacterium MalM25]|nr:3-deoxy-D-manno-octulosonate 8-phosphate phosphatase KdsC [Planctomycetes bacterium MalM25]
MQRIALLLTDVDGVLTDGGITFDGNGVETKTFNVRDGLGVRLWQRAGGRFGIITGRASKIVEQRGAELDIEFVYQAVKEKLSVVRNLAKELGLSLDQIAYVGDDLPDLPTIRAVGFGAAPTDAAPELLESADYVTTAPGGRGVLREVIEKLLKDSGMWEEATGPLHG